MYQIKNYLKVEVSGDTLRLILLDATGELACRKVRRSDLMNEIRKDFSALFKGRLQLKVEENHIHVLLNKVPALTMKKDKFLELLAAQSDDQAKAGE